MIKSVHLFYYPHLLKKYVMQNKMKWALLLIVMISLAACAGSKGSKGCGCPSKKGMVGY